jgi:hypothetical protein
MTTEHNPYLQFTREQWALLRDAVPLTLTEHDLQTLRGINEKVSLREVEEIYLPLSRLLNLYVKAKQRRSRVLEQFLGQSRGKGTYIISIAGSVAGARAPRPHPAGIAGALAGAPAGGAGHHRRLPVSQQGAGSPWPDASQGVPRVL